MASKSSNRAEVPEAKEALDRFKMEVAQHRGHLSGSVLVSLHSSIVTVQITLDNNNFFVLQQKGNLP